MAKRKPSAGLAMPPIPPTMHLDGEHAAAVKGRPVGSTVRMIVHGKVVGQSQDSYGGRASHSTRIEVSRVRPAGKGAPRGKTK